MKPAPWVEHLVSKLRSEAEHRASRWPQDPAVSVLMSVADEVEEAARNHAEEPLTLQQAEAESGYSYSALQKMVAVGRLPNVGDVGKPLVRRGDLPRKPTANGKRAGNGEPDLAGIILDNG